MGSIQANQPMAAESFEILRAELLRASAKISCAQALELADLLHAVIRMRKRHPCLRNLEDLLVAEVESVAPAEPRSFAQAAEAEVVVLGPAGLAFREA